MYSSMGPAAFRRLPEGGFTHVRLVPVCPVPGAWLVSGSMSAYRKVCRCGRGLAGRMDRADGLGPD